MDIFKNLQEDLWESIKKSYISEDYTTAILNAIAYLRDTIREKSNLELDGIDLINQAFSDKHPKISVSNMETKNDKNIQRGLRDLLIGIYTHIRNPRSHDKYVDNKKDAIAIILFVNYLLNIINKSKSSFSGEEFIKQVYDDYFHPTKKYGELLVKDIPKKQIEDTFYKLYASINNYIIYEAPNYYGYGKVEKEKILNLDNKIKALQIIFPLLIEKLPNSKNNIFQKISNNIHLYNNSFQLFVKIIIFIEYWSELSEKVRLRTIQFLTKVDIQNDNILKYYQKEILSLGKIYFNNEEKKIIQNNQLNINELYVSEDEIPF